MKKVFTSAMFFISVLNMAEAQKFEWAKRAGSYAFDLGYGVASDNSGNVYISGKYELNSNFGGTYVGCAGNHDIYVAKYGSDGSFKWVRTAGGSSGDYTHALTCDGEGNTYLTGEFELTTKFSSTSTITSNGGNDVFVAKYNTNGDLQWAKKLGGGGKSDRGLGISVSGGFVYLCGEFERTAWFAGGNNLTSAGGRDIFIAKYSIDGVLQWVKRAGGAGDDSGYAICNDSSGNFYVTGFFSQTANFQGITISSSGGGDIFLAKYTPDGNLVWLKKAGGGANDYGMGIKADNSGRIFLTGGFRLKSYFGTISQTAQGGDADIFVARYTSNGDLVWVKKAGGRINDYGRALAIDSSSNIFITGNYGLTATFGGNTIQGADSAEIYFASWDVNGNLKWVLPVTGPTDDPDPGRFIEMGLSICTDPSGNVIGSGAYRYNSQFGNTLLKEWDHTEVYLTKINPNLTARTMDISAEIYPEQDVKICPGESIELKVNECDNCTYKWFRNGNLIKDAEHPEYQTNEEGFYTIEVSNEFNTVQSSHPIKVNFTEGIKADISMIQINNNDQEEIVLLAEEGNDFHYEWMIEGEIIPESDQIILKPEISGNYRVAVIQGNCIRWSEELTIEIKNKKQKIDSIITGNISSNKNNHFRVLPNPNNGSFMIEFNVNRDNNESGLINIEIVNETGQIVYFNSLSAKSSNSVQQIELDKSIPSGIYFLKLTQSDTSETTRILLNR